MKTIHKNISWVIAMMGIILTLAVACKETAEEEQLSFKRIFAPSFLEANNGETAVRIQWSSSLFTTEGETEYVLEVSDTTTFSEITYTTTTKELEVIITDSTLESRKDYFARVKAVGSDGRDDSNWLVSDAFRILGEQWLLAPTNLELLDIAVRLRWLDKPGLTTLVMTPEGGEPIEFELEVDELADRMKQIDDLEPNTNYTVELFQDELYKGTVIFKTKADLFAGVASVIDLRTILDKPSILVDTLPDIPSGSVVVLKRGQTYNVATAYSFDKSFKIVSGLDFVASYAKIFISSNFNMVTTSNIDSLVFQDINFVGNDYATNYVFNTLSSTAGSISKMKFENCTGHKFRGFVRVQGSTGTGVTVNNLSINNCMLDSLRDFGVVTMSSASSFVNISITNTTISRARKVIVRGGVAGTPAAIVSFTMENCTLNNCPSMLPATGQFYVIDFNTVDVGSLNITNCILGKSWDEGLAGVDAKGWRAGTSTTVNASNSYITSDFVNVAGNELPFTPYTGSSTALFVDPANGNFEIKDENFAGLESAGDPRWK